MKPTRLVVAFAISLALICAVYASVLLHEPAVMAISTSELDAAGIDYTGCTVTNGFAIVSGYINHTMTDEAYAAKTNSHVITSANIIGYDKTAKGANGIITCYNDMQRTNVEYTFTRELPATLQIKAKANKTQKPGMFYLGGNDEPAVKAQSTDTSKKKRPIGCGCFRMKRDGGALIVR